MSRIREAKKMKGRIAVTPRSLSREGHPALEELRRAGYEVIFPAPGRMPTEAELGEFLPQCVGLLAGVEPISAEVLSQCPQLKVISRNGVGVDSIDLAAAAEMGIAVEKAVGANSRGVAELAAALMLSGLRRICWSDRRLKEGDWARPKGIEVLGRQLGVVGCGQIGRHLVEIGLGLGMRVRAFDLYPDQAFKPPGDFGYVGLDELIRESDVISLHCPPEAEPIIGPAAVSSMKEGVFIINTARASLVDDAAILNGLESGKIRGFATDVFPSEPPEPTPLLLHERVVLTPHAGAFTEESILRATEGAVDNLLKVLEK